ncbi:winged helix-turn-helix domain-containing protein [Anaerospora sp.]|uniref:winged helix-turn-helix domain-containing protein n=1 Tax=Anaerospora sp. TaxID=1960278 RepID=UPI002899A6F0|nr:winged helix-turn-helix domain-containing protein [Anaerospora sp.]
MTHRQLLKAVWGTAYNEDTHYIRVYIGQLRRKIEADPTQPRHIITESGVGYRLMEH